MFVLTYNPQLTHFDFTKNALAKFKERDKIPIFTEDKCWKLNANISTDKKKSFIGFYNNSYNLISNVPNRIDNKFKINKIEINT